MKTREQKRREAEDRNARTRPDRRRNARRGCPTGKRIIHTENEARAELVGTLIRANRGNPNRRECRFYQCDQCDYWHLTSKPSTPPHKETTQS